MNEKIEVIGMKKIVIIGANDFQNPLILKAKKMGYETHVFAWKDGSIGERTADYFYPISIVEKQQILEVCQTIHPDAVATIASDLAGITVNYLARNLGLVCNSERNILISTNKYEMRKAFLDFHVPTPGFQKVFQTDDLTNVKKQLQLPVIVKPTDRSGSRAITKLETFEGLEEAVQLATKESFEHAAIVEEYIEGNEYSCECISYEGIHYFLAVTKKFTTGNPHFIETGHIEPSGLNQVELETVKKHIFQALDALEIRYGASHSEFKIDKNGNVRIIEIGARMGGDCIGSDLVQISTGYDFVRMVIEVASGEKPDFTKICEPKVAIIKFIFTQEDAEQLRKIEKLNSEKLFFTSQMELQEIHDVVDSSSRYGFYILKCDSVAEAMELTKL